MSNNCDISLNVEVLASNNELTTSKYGVSLQNKCS